MIAAKSPMIASTQRISISAKPASVPRSARAAGNIGCRSTAAFLTVGAKRDDFKRRALARRAIDIIVAPRIVGHHAAAQIRPVPARCVVAARQRGEPLIGARIASEVEIIEIERAGKTFDLDFCRLGLGLAEIVQHPRPDQRHDQADDGNDHQNFDQREAGLRMAATPRFSLCQIPKHGGQLPKKLQPTIWLTDISAVMTDTINPPTTILITMIAAGPAMPTTRSSVRCSFAS